jgi:2-polyprenyl-3-methyl-5-hydroxy-6-metoxy-1,4-benzoquinol methylase
MKEAQKHDVPVMLTGFGGDELFWGYPWVVEAMIENTKKLSLLGDSPQARARLARELTFYERHYDFKAAEQVLPNLYTSSFKQNISPQNSFRPFRIDEPYDSLPVRICRALFDTWLVSNCIVLGDRLSMASSVELRLPLLDYKLVELVMGLRKTYKTDYTLEPKIWLKEAVRNILPERIMNYPKRGFTPPVKKWFSAAIEHYGHLLTDGCLVKDKIIDPDGLQHLLIQPIGGGSLQHFVYKLLVLEMWSRSVLGDQISSLPTSHYEKQNQRVEKRLTENKLALFAEELVKKAVHMLKQGRESEAMDYFDVGARLRPESTQQQCQQVVKLLDQSTLAQICSQARRMIATTPNHRGGRLLLECARSCLDEHNTTANGHWDNSLRTPALEDNQCSAHVSANQQVPHSEPSCSAVGLFDAEPSEVSTAKQVVKSYYESRLNSIWKRSNHPVWFDHEIDYYRWPKNLFWIERGVFGRMVMKPGCRVLDLCSGDGYYSDVWYSTIAGNIDACDNDEDALRFASQKHNNPKIDYHHIDILTDPFPKPEYDVITWFEAIEHFSEENQNFILGNIRSALSQNGTLIGSTTMVKLLGNPTNRQHDREFTSQKDVADVLRDVFSKVQTWASMYPDRTTCYFQCSK